MNQAEDVEMGMHLSDLLNGLTELPPHFDRVVTGLTQNSRQIRPGDLFIAVRGRRSDGRDFIEQAVSSKAAAVVAEADAQYCEPFLSGEVPVIPVVNKGDMIDQIAARFYGYSAQHLWLIGVTGTNGKTSITQFIAQWYQQLGQACGVSGTLGSGLYGDLQPVGEQSPATTPDAIHLQSLYSQVLQDGARVMVLEVTSHGLDQNRVNADDMNVAVFSNLSRDHLDYHGSMQAYGEAKARLFRGRNLKTAVINLDDEFSKTIQAALEMEVPVFTYSLTDQKATVHASQVSFQPQGIVMTVSTPWGSHTFTCALLGEFNASNLLAAIAVVLAGESRKTGFDFNQVIKPVAGLLPVSGRMEMVDCEGASQVPSVIVDYAHTPDALKTALSALRHHFNGDVWCVFGCGGDRDAGKRPLMAAAVEQYADHVVVTDDNPRSEMSQDIINDICSGFTGSKEIVVEPNRAKAIAGVINQAAVEDVVLIAGKGHESYQEVNGSRLPFSDVAQARLCLRERCEREGMAR